MTSGAGRRFKGSSLSSEVGRESVCGAGSTAGGLMGGGSVAHSLVSKQSSAEEWQTRKCNVNDAMYGPMLFIYIILW